MRPSIVSPVAATGGGPDAPPAPSERPIPRQRIEVWHLADLQQGVEKPAITRELATEAGAIVLSPDGRLALLFGADLCLAARWESGGLEGAPT